MQMLPADGMEGTIEPALEDSEESLHGVRHDVASRVLKVDVLDGVVAALKHRSQSDIAGVLVGDKAAFRST
jgi:hypothetical protein